MQTRLATRAAHTHTPMHARVETTDGMYGIHLGLTVGRGIMGSQYRSISAELSTRTGTS